MGWLELTLELPAEALPQAEALMELAGARSIAIADGGDAPIFEPEPETTPLWPSLTVRALFDEHADGEAITALLGPLAGGKARLELISDAACESAPAPVEKLEIGPRLTIVPAETLDGTGRHALGLHMGLAFGTGQHPTTQLCLEWLERELRPGISVLDYGAGSGVLALAALKLGAASATAIDTEPQALTATRRNAELNGLGGLLTIGAPAALPDPARFDLIVANILARPLIALVDTFARHQPAGGQIVLSGILVSQLEALESAYAVRYEAFATQQRSGWALLTGSRRAV